MAPTFFLEVIGTIAFAFSGAFVAIECRLDIFGILCAAVVTATGGGMTRDIILGNTPPLMFRDPTYVIIAILFAFATVLIYVPLVKSRFKKNILGIINVLDAIGLAVFTIVGMNNAVQFGYGDNCFLVCFVGVLSAVGGGLIRDIFVDRKPVILQKEIYATASLVGSVFYYYGSRVLPGYLSPTISMVLIFLIRVWSLHRDINLPLAEKPPAGK